jgi:hypothetical protein
MKLHAGLAVLLVILFTLAGCGLTGRQGCTLIGTPIGLGIDIEPPLAASVATATITVCWNGECRDAAAWLAPSSAAVSSTCDAVVCAAQMSPTGGKHGFADVSGLPTATPVQVTVRLDSADGGRLVDQTVQVTPTLAYPNGPNCGAGGPQARVVVTANGSVHARP